MIERQGYTSEILAFSRFESELRHPFLICLREFDQLLCFYLAIRGPICVSSDAIASLSTMISAVAMESKNKSNSALKTGSLALPTNTSISGEFRFLEEIEV